jgi:hypothetical protein
MSSKSRKQADLTARGERPDELVFLPTAPERLEGAGTDAGGESLACHPMSNS